MTFIKLLVEHYDEEKSLYTESEMLPVVKTKVPGALKPPESEEEDETNSDSNEEHSWSPNSTQDTATAEADSTEVNTEMDDVTQSEEGVVENGAPTANSVSSTVDFDAEMKQRNTDAEDVATIDYNDGAKQHQQQQDTDGEDSIPDNKRPSIIPQTQETQEASECVRAKPDLSVPETQAEHLVSK